MGDFKPQEHPIPRWKSNVQVAYGGESLIFSGTGLSHPFTYGRWMLSMKVIALRNTVVFCSRSSLKTRPIPM